MLFLVFIARIKDKKWAITSAKYIWFSLFQQFLLINLVGFSFIVCVNLAKLIWKHIYTVIFIYT